MAATVMTVEFGTIHHIILVWRKILVVQFFEQIQNLIEHNVNYDIFV